VPDDFLSFPRAEEREKMTAMTTMAAAMIDTYVTRTDFFPRMREGGGED